jgi:hypothetical protein
LLYRAYNLGDPSQRSEFVEDFRLCAASNILKVIKLSVVILMHYRIYLFYLMFPVLFIRLCYLPHLTAQFVARPPFPDNVYMADDTLRNCFLAVSRFLYRHSTGDPFHNSSADVTATPKPHPPRPSTAGASCSTRRVQFVGPFPARENNQAKQTANSGVGNESFTDQGCCDKVSGLSEQDWEAILSASYRVAMSMRQSRLEVPYSAVLRNHRSTPRQVRAALLLQELERIDPQFRINGARNIWVIKVSR